MLFAKRLREGVARGDITCSVRIWMSPRVTEGRRYRMGDGEIGRWPTSTIKYEGAPFLLVMREVGFPVAHPPGAGGTVSNPFDFAQDNS